MAITDNMRIPPEYIGVTGLLTPGITVCSGPRLEIFAKNIYQPRVPDTGGDVPDMFTGFESIIGDYCFNSSTRKNTIKIIKIIDKYSYNISNIKPGNNPLRTVIFRDMVTGEIDYFDIRRYSSYANDYGYENIMRHNVREGDVIEPDVEIYSSPIKKGDAYCMGVNANVIFGTFLETTEDCFAISESLADKMTPLSIEERSISINMRKYPLNLYGNEDDFKIIPDIGDHVNQDGVLCAFRPIKRFSAMSDLQLDKLRKINHMFDHKIYAHPGAKVVDISVYMDVKNILPDNINNQLRVYYDATLNYWRQIVEIYDQFKNNNISFKFNTLVAKAAGRLLAARQPVPGINKKQKANLVESFNQIVCHIDVTLMNKVVINKGHKSAGRDGCKGVFVIKPDDEMPIDEQGFRADIAIDPISILKRTNTIQLYEQYINRVLKWQAMNLNSLGSIENQYNRIIEVLNDINPEYAKIVNMSCNNLTKVTEYVNECKADTIKICVPPSLDTLGRELIKKLVLKYKTPVSRVSFVAETANGKETKVTKKPMVIGSKYVYLLAKYPKPSSPGYGHINRCHMPVASPGKNSTPINTKPIRFGESESRIFVAATDIKSVLRFKSLFGGSKIGADVTINTLMKEDRPSDLSKIDVSTEELYDNTPPVRIVHHMLNTCGIDIQNSLISVDDAKDLFDISDELL